MRSFSPTTAAYFATRAGFIGHVLIWFQAKNRATLATEAIGFWTGPDHQVFIIDGQDRTYYAAGNMLKIDPIRRVAGLKVRSQRVTFSQISPEAQLAVRGYDIRHAPVEMHRALFDPLSHNLIDAPHVLLRDYVDKAPITTPAKGGAGQIAIEIASAGRALTKPLSRFRSNASMEATRPGDGFRKFASVADVVEVKWSSS